MTNTQAVKKVLDDLYTLFQKKNRDYGNAAFQRPLFTKVSAREAALVAVSTKVQRVKTLSKKSGDANFESLEDSIRDLANYCVIWLALLEKERARIQSSSGQAATEQEEPVVCESPVTDDCAEYARLRPFTCCGRFVPIKDEQVEEI